MQYEPQASICTIVVFFYLIFKLTPAPLSTPFLFLQAHEAGPVPLVLDLRIAHDRVGSSTDPNLNGHFKYPDNFDQSLNDVPTDKVRKYRTDYNNRTPSVVSFIPAIASTSSGYIVNLSDFYSYRLIGPLPPRGCPSPSKKQSWSGSCKGGSFTYYA